MSHTCHAKGCNTKCKPEYLMCPKCWRLVPRVFQNLVYRYYREGQCELDPPPSEKWHAAADMAIISVALKQGKVTQETYDKTKYRCNIILQGGNSEDS